MSVSAFIMYFPLLAVGRVAGLFDRFDHVVVTVTAYPVPCGSGAVSK